MKTTRHSVLNSKLASHCTYLVSQLDTVVHVFHVSQGVLGIVNELLDLVLHLKICVLDVELEQQIKLS